MATIFDLEMEDEVVEAVPPHKFWRAVFTSKWRINLTDHYRDPYDAVPPLRLSQTVIVAGPLCPTAELAETLALAKCARKQKYLTSIGRKWGIQFARPIKVDEKGEPI